MMYVYSPWLEALLFSDPSRDAREGIVLTRSQTYLNIVLDEAYEDKKEGGRERMGMCVVRGNSVVLVEPMERIGGDHHHGGGGRR